MALQQIISCRKMAEQLEQEVTRLSLDSNSKVQLETLLHSAKESLVEAEKLMKSEKVVSQARLGKQLLWERKLLDLSMHNNLLNMKVGKKVSAFTPCPIDQLEDLLADGEEYLVPSELVDAKTLKSLYRTARLMMEENGVNTLFLTLGTIHYGEKYSAPILLLPIDIISARKDKYIIRARDEETMLNFTLVEYLRQNYDIGIAFRNKQSADNSELPHDAHGIDVNLVLYTVKQAISQQEGWSVTEDSHIGIFSFAKPKFRSTLV